MLVTMPLATVEALWCALEKPTMGAWPGHAAEIGRAAAATGWIAHLEIEDLILSLDPRLGQIRVQHILEGFGVRGQWVHPRPRERTAGVLGIEQVAAVDVAHILILLERLGFAVDPSPMCVPLLPSLKTRAYLTDAELAVYRHDRERHRIGPIEVSSETSPAWGADRTLLTETGHRVEMFRGDEGRPFALRATALRRRQSKPRLSLVA